VDRIDPAGLVGGVQRLAVRSNRDVLHDPRDVERAQTRLQRRHFDFG